MLALSLLNNMHAQSHANVFMRESVSEVLAPQAITLTRDTLLKELNNMRAHTQYTHITSHTANMKNWV